MKVILTILLITIAVLLYYSTLKEELTCDNIDKVHTTIVYKDRIVCIYSAKDLYGKYTVKIEKKRRS